MYISEQKTLWEKEMVNLPGSSNFPKTVSKGSSLKCVKTRPLVVKC